MLQLAEFLQGKPLLDHEVFQRSGPVIRAGTLFVIEHEIPVDEIVFGRARLFAMADVEYFLLRILKQRQRSEQRCKQQDERQEKGDQKFIDGHMPR
jgi:hypothetical protein